MKIYVASSWKNADIVYSIGTLLREQKYEVDCFCDNSNGRYVFHWKEIIEDKNAIDAVSFLKDERSQKAFKEDKKWLNWCDYLILVLPCGNSAHLEAGYIKGQGKKLIIYAPYGFIPGEFDVMYGFADLMTDKFEELLEMLKKGRQ